MMKASQRFSFLLPDGWQIVVLWLCMAGIAFIGVRMTASALTMTHLDDSVYCFVDRVRESSTLAEATCGSEMVEKKVARGGPSPKVLMCTMREYRAPVWFHWESPVLGRKFFNCDVLTTDELKPDGLPYGTMCRDALRTCYT